VNVDGRSTLGVPSAQQQAARVSMLMLDGAKLPSVARAKYKRWRDRHAEPSPLARVLATPRELRALGIPRERAQLAVDAFQREVDAAYGAPVVGVTARDFEMELSAEAAENALTLRYLTGDHSPVTCLALAAEMKREVAIQNAMIRSLEAEAAAGMR